LFGIFMRLRWCFSHGFSSERQIRRGDDLSQSARRFCAKQWRPDDANRTRPGLAVAAGIIFRRADGPMGKTWWNGRFARPGRAAMLFASLAALLALRRTAANLMLSAMLVAGWNAQPVYLFPFLIP